MLSSLLYTALFTASINASPNPDVVARYPNGETNPSEPSLGTPVNQESLSRLASVNSFDDFCLYGPQQPLGNIGENEATVVAWCTKPRNNARTIPDGALHAVHVYNTPRYIQVVGYISGEYMNINPNDPNNGGELDPHGQFGLGNPVGGNVTSDVSGSDVFYAEWMNYMNGHLFCIRVCTAETDQYPATEQCNHIYDVMGCQWVMPGNYDNSSFTTCDADSAYPPGWYPQADGSVSKFQQRYTGTQTYTVNGAESTSLYTIGQTVTPPQPYSTPASSNCVTHSSPANGIASLAVLAAANGGMSISSSPASSSSDSASPSSSLSSSIPLSSILSSSISSSLLASNSSSSIISSSASSSNGTVSIISSSSSSGSIRPGPTATSSQPSVSGSVSQSASSTGAPSAAGSVIFHSEKILFSLGSAALLALGMVVLF